MLLKILRQKNIKYIGNSYLSLLSVVLAIYVVQKLLSNRLSEKPLKI